MRTGIVYEDDQVIVIHKPAGLATQTARIGQPDVVSELKNYRKGGYVGVVHRLDQPVEGLLVFGKTPEATAKLSGALSGDGLNKSYYAVVCGVPVPSEKRLVDELIKTKDNRAQVVHDDKAAKKAILTYRVEQSLISDASKDIAISLVKVCIETGRFHQIRCQMAHAGHPLLGDFKYGNDRSAQTAKAFPVDSVALCAYEISFIHPTTGKKLSFRKNPEGRAFQVFFGA